MNITTQTFARVSRPCPAETACAICASRRSIVSKLCDLAMSTLAGGVIFYGLYKMATLW